MRATEVTRVCRPSRCSLALFHISQGIGVCQTGSKKGASPPHPAKGWGAHAVFFGLGVRLWSLSFAFSACSHGLTFTPRTTKKKKPLREISNLCWSFLSALQNPIPTHFSLFRKKHLPNRGAKIRLCARCPVVMVIEIEIDPRSLRACFYHRP